MDKRNKSILTDSLFTFFLLVILGLHLFQPFTPNSTCVDCFPSILIGLYIGLMACVARGVRDPIAKSGSDAEVSNHSFKTTMLFGIYVFLYLVVSAMATPHFERLFVVGSLTSLIFIMLFRLLLHRHYRNEVEDGANNLKEVQKSVAWLDDLAKREGAKDDE